MLKQNIEWIKKNVPSDLKIWKQMISEIDWGEVKKNTKQSLKLDKERIIGEFKGFHALSAEVGRHHER